MPPQKTEEKPSGHALTIRLPDDVYEDLRRQAFEERTSMNALIVAALKAAKT